MLNKNKERELAYIVKVDSVEKIDGYDRIEYATVGGWHCVVGTGMKAGDKAVYFEIDSLLPSQDERFKFCERYKYKVKTQKYCKGTKISQGLLMPISEFPEFADKEVGYFVTKELGINYYDPMDRARKSKNKEKQYKPLFKKIKNYFPFKQLMRTKIGRKILFAIFGVKKKREEFPWFVPKTDEERINNCAYVLNDKSPVEMTEKVDGSSATYAVCKTKFGKLKFYVCSRNVVLQRDSKSYYDDNIWYEMWDRYNIKNFLIKFIKETNSDYVYLQGEVFGNKVQKRNYGLSNERDFRAFILCTSNRVRYSYEETKEILDKYNIPTVPIIDNNYILPDTVDELIELAKGDSMIDGEPREGLVFRRKEDPTQSFKAVDPEFLMKYH